MKKTNFASSHSLWMLGNGKGLFSTLVLTVFLFLGGLSLQAQQTYNLPDMKTNADCVTLLNAQLSTLNAQLAALNGNDNDPTYRPLMERIALYTGVRDDLAANYVGLDAKVSIAGHSNYNLYTTDAQAILDLTSGSYQPLITDLVNLLRQ